METREGTYTPKLPSPTVSWSKRHLIHARFRGSHVHELLPWRTPPLTRHWVLRKSQKWGAFLSASGLPSPSSDRIILSPKVTNTPWHSVQSLGCHGLVFWYRSGRWSCLIGSARSSVLPPRDVLKGRIWKSPPRSCTLVQAVRHRERWGALS